MSEEHTPEQTFFLNKIIAEIPALQKVRAADELLRPLLPVTSLELLTAAVVALLRDDEPKAAKKLMFHFFSRTKERRAFMKLVKARLEALTFKEAF
jgi:hypothetical protein